MPFGRRRSTAVDTSALTEQLISSEDSSFITGCLPFDLLTRGKGLPCGITQFWSTTGLGKSTAALSIARCLAQREEKTLYVASEPNEDLAEAMGLFQEPLLNSFEMRPCILWQDLLEVTHEFMSSDSRLMIVDSLSAFVSTEMLSKGYKLEDTHVAGSAKYRQPYLQIAHGLCRLHPDKAIVFIVQTRANFNAGWTTNIYDAEIPEGGKGLMFLSKMSVTQRGDAQVSIGSAQEQEPVGKRGYLICPVKNRLARPKVKIPFSVIFGSGVSNVYSIMCYLEWKGMLGSIGSGYYRIKLTPDGEDLSLRGKDEIKQYITENYRKYQEGFYEDIPEYFDSIAAGFEPGAVVTK